jgi:hypothetical protein
LTTAGGIILDEDDLLEVRSKIAARAAAKESQKGKGDK